MKLRYTVAVIAAAAVASISSCSAAPQAASEVSASPIASNSTPQSGAATATPTPSAPKSLSENFVGTWTCTGEAGTMLNISKTATLKINEDNSWQAQWDEENPATTWDAKGNGTSAGRLSFNGSQVTLMIDAVGKIRGGSSVPDRSEYFFSNLTPGLPATPIVVLKSDNLSKETTKYRFAANRDTFAIADTSGSNKSLVCKRS